jgi:hypothetical protein
MRVLIGALVLAVCASASAHRLEAWRSNRALWTAAVITTPQSPEAALRMGALHLQYGEWEAAATWTFRAVQLWEARPRPERPFPGAVPFSESLRRQAWLVDTFSPVCHRPEWARVCA